MSATGSSDPSGSPGPAEPLTGILLVGGASSRFGSPKALARLGGGDAGVRAGETLAERGRRTLAAACDEVLVVGKAADGLPLPFPLIEPPYPSLPPPPPPRAVDPSAVVFPPLSPFAALEVAPAPPPPITIA